MEMDFSGIDVSSLSEEEVKAMLASADSSIYNCPPNVFQQDFWVTDQASQSQPTDNVYGFNVNTPTYDAAYGLSPDPYAGEWADSQAGVQVAAYQGSGSEGSSPDVTEGGFRCDCGKSWEKRRDFRKHNWSVHNRRFECEANEYCVYMGADKREMERHYWSNHREYARENNVKDVSGSCEACGKTYGRKDRVGRHLKKSPACRRKLGLCKEVVSSFGVGRLLGVERL
ncbi:hypothetical protein ACJZ2D_003207 [Fusarium nematophilum]